MANGLVKGSGVGEREWRDDFELVSDAGVSLFKVAKSNGAITAAGTLNTTGTTTVGALNVTGLEQHAPARGSVTGQVYLANYLGDLLLGTANAKTYVLGITATRPATSVATGDSNDAGMRISMSNYAANDTNYYFRGLNVGINNRSGGVAMLENSMGAQGKSGGTCGIIVPLAVTAENYGTVTDRFGGIDVLLKNEGAVATLEYGIRIRNENNSLATKVTSAILVSDTGVNTGWTTGLNLNGATLTNEIVLSNGCTIRVSAETIVFTHGSNLATITMSGGGGSIS